LGASARFFFFYARLCLFPVGGGFCRAVSTEFVGRVLFICTPFFLQQTIPTNRVFPFKAARDVLLIQTPWGLFYVVVSGNTLGAASVCTMICFFGRPSQRGPPVPPGAWARGFFFSNAFSHHLLPFRWIRLGRRRFFRVHGPAGFFSSLNVPRGAFLIRPRKPVFSSGLWSGTMAFLSPTGRLPCVSVPQMKWAAGRAGPPSLRPRCFRVTFFFFLSPFLAVRALKLLDVPTIQKQSVCFLGHPFSSRRLLGDGSPSLPEGRPGGLRSLMRLSVT